MSTLTLPKKGGNFNPPPPGTHVGICYRIVDLGTQITTYKGNETKKRLVRLQWELPNELMPDGKPFVASKRYTFSSSKKAIFRKDLENWRTRPFTEDEFGSFDISKLLGKGCMLSIVHDARDGEVYANVNGVMALPKGTNVPTTINEAYCFSLEAFDQITFEKLPEGTRNMIISSPEYREIKGLTVPDPVHDEQVTREEQLDDEIPF